MLASPWPTQVDFQDALQNPAVCFGDPELQTAVPTDLTPFGLPSPITGQFANVYRFRRVDGSSCAVRLFIGPSRDRPQRYAAITQHLDSLRPALPPFFVPAAYEERGVQVRGAWYPLVKMDWVAGPTLNTFIDAHLYDGERLRDLAEQFRTLVSSLYESRVAHGDLQHGNLLVEQETGKLRLVDYDGMWVPSLAGWEGNETGHPSYQHPRRTIKEFGPFLDRFSALAIYTALRALTVAPNAWFRLDNGDNLLFRKEDFRDPVESVAFRTLRDALLRAPVERRYVDALRNACTAALVRVPDLETLVGQGGKGQRD
jgi:hypothetical protein